ncbi:MAG: amidohydrolase family protein [Pirellulales bacterium]|nr:amidohydrolase family protein [Pirellulales bacterium]
MNLQLGRLAALLSLLCCAAANVSAADAPLVFTGAKIITLAGDDIEVGRLVVAGGKIVAVGPKDQIEVPTGAKEIDVTGRTIMPGLVDTHSHVGGMGGADSSGPIQPGVRILDAINPRDAGFKRAVAGGLTTLNIMPGSGHLISGQTLYAKMRVAGSGPNKIDDLFILDVEGKPLGGLKMANGTNSQRNAPFPGTRGKSAFLVREQFIKAREYQAAVARAGGDAAKLPARDLNLEALNEAMAGKRVVHHHTHRHDDIMTVLRLKQEFGFKVVLHHVSDGWKVADEIAAAQVPCSVIVIDSPGGKLEARDMSFATGAILDKAGVRVAYHTDDYINDSRIFLRSAALGVRAGLPRQKALESVTLAGAEMLELADRIGSLAPGKDADFAIFDGDPLSVYSKVQQTWVEGVKVFDREDPQDRLIAEGGFGAGYERRPYLCCAEGEAE